MRISRRTISLALPLLLIACAKAPPAKQQQGASSQSPTAAKPRSSDKRVAAIQDRIDKLGPETLATLEKVKGAKLTVSGRKSDKSLGEIADLIVKKAGIEGIGWEAFKNRDGSWFVWYHFKDGQGKLTYAKWHYDPRKNSIVPVDQHGTEFSYMAPEAK